MSAPSSWANVAVEVLNAPSAGVARAALASALLQTCDASIAARVRVREDCSVSWYVVTGAGRAPANTLPPRRAVTQHPLRRFHCEGNHSEPAWLPAVVDGGFELSRETRYLMELLGLGMHQVSVPVETPSASTGFDGWMLVGAECPCAADGASALASIAASAGLIRGLDRHIRLLRELPVPAGIDPPLTPREVLVLNMIASGRTVEGIAARLQISPRTVHKHQERLYRKLGAVDRLSAVLKAQESGLLPPPGLQLAPTFAADL